MDDKALSELLKLLYRTPCDECELSMNSDSDASASSRECSNSPYENLQIFSDHVMTTRRFQKTLYYGELSHSNFHPPFSLTDATLELFNKTVPNSGRLDILTMDYAASVSRTVCVSPYSMVLAMMYLEQLRHKNPDYLESVSPCELFVVSILIASKYLFDNDEEFTYNCDWAEAAHMEVQDLNKLERDFLYAINWELFVTEADFFTFLSKVEQRIAVKRASQKGWLSYTDVYVLSSHRIFMQIWLDISGIIFKVVVVITMSYIAAVLVVVGACKVTFMSQRPAEAVIQGIISYDSPSSLPVLQWFSHEPDVCFVDNPENSKQSHQNMDSSSMPHYFDDFECAKTESHYCEMRGSLSSNFTTNCSMCTNVKKLDSIVMSPNGTYLQWSLWDFSSESDFVSLLDHRSVVISQNCSYSVLQT